MHVRMSAMDEWWRRFNDPPAHGEVVQDLRRQHHATHAVTAVQGCGATRHVEAAQRAERGEECNPHHTIILANTLVSFFKIYFKRSETVAEERDTKRARALKRLCGAIPCKKQNGWHAGLKYDGQSGTDTSG